MTKMERLILQRNGFDGQIPSCMGQWENLETLILSDNQLTGEIPRELVHLDFRRFWVDDNMLEGDPIPILHNMTRSESVYLSNNFFSGIIDDRFLNEAANLVALDLSNNNFTSTDYAFPKHLLEKKELRLLDLSRNNLQGEMHTHHIPHNLTMQFFSVHENLITGSIPSRFQHMLELFHLDISNNAFTGTIPEDIFTISTLEILFLGGNDGLSEAPIPEGIERMTQLREISLKGTNRNGSLPELLNFTLLELLDLDNNQLQGPIPSSYGSLSSLRHLLLNRNLITGEIPNFEDCPLLQTVLLDGGNNITGNFSSICALPSFSELLDNDAKNDLGFLNELVAVVTTCANEALVTGCECCQCCDKAEGCVDPVIASLDWSWELKHTRTGRDFKINMTQFD